MASFSVSVNPPPVSVRGLAGQKSCPLFEPSRLLLIVLIRSAPVGAVRDQGVLLPAMIALAGSHDRAGQGTLSHVVKHVEC